MTSSHAAGEVRTVSINSCLATVGSLDGMAVTTVEGIGNSETGLHGVQGAHAALHHNFASSCRLRHTTGLTDCVLARSGRPCGLRLVEITTGIPEFLDWTGCIVHMLVFAFMSNWWHATGGHGTEQELCINSRSEGCDQTVMGMPQ